jgi:hypothetical protein
MEIWRFCSECRQIIRIEGVGGSWSNFWEAEPNGLFVCLDCRPLTPNLRSLLSQTVDKFFGWLLGDYWPLGGNTPEGTSTPPATNVDTLEFSGAIADTYATLVESGWPREQAVAYVAALLDNCYDDYFSRELKNIVLSPELNPSQQAILNDIKLVWPELRAFIDERIGK